MMKEVGDRFFASAVLLLVSPLLLLIAIGVKANSPGPVLYRQERMSWNGRTFNRPEFECWIN